MFIRRFSSDPGNAVLTEIEAVDIIDLPPPATIAGVGSGTVCIVGEFENGPFDTPTEVSGGTDLLNTFGGFGFVQNGTKANNPCARKRTADAGPATAWNGNGFVALAGKKFARLIVVRPDTSTGAVTITPSPAPTVTTVVPAGTVCSTSGSVKYVTMQDLTFPAGSTTAQSVKVRPATDDGTDAGVAIAAVTTISVSGFTVTNAAAINAALTESAIDSAYQVALDSTLDMNGVAHDINVIFSARQSAALRSGLRSNAQNASADGLLGRVACIRPPLNTTKTTAKGSVAPGVGATRDERVFYCYPQNAVFLPTIASVGTAGGYGFTATGVVDVGADSLLASVLSQLAPEENPGQVTTFTGGVMGLESGANAQGFLMSDYTSFRGAGIVSPRVQNGVVIFQSGVTSVDPAVNPELRNIARRRMADFIEDSLSLRLENFGKKLNTFARRKAVASEIRTFLNTLLSPNNPSSARIAAFAVDEKSGNTAASLALGIFRIIVRVQTLSSMDAIVLQAEIGESVDLSQLS